MSGPPERRASDFLRSFVPPAKRCRRPLPRPGPSGAIDRCSRRPTKRRWPCRRANRPSRRKAVARPTDENGRSRAFLRSRVARNNGPFLGEHSFSHSRIGPLGPDRRAHLL